MSISPTISRRELEALSRRYMQEMIPFVGPHTDVMAPDMGTNEQVMAWFMDTYSMYQGRTVTEIVTGKPVASGGTLGRREATGRGVAHLARRVMKELAIDLNNATAVIQGFGNVGSYAALELHQFGLKVIAVSDHTGALHDAAGPRYSGADAARRRRMAASPAFPTSCTSIPRKFSRCPAMSWCRRRWSA